MNPDDAAPFSTAGQIGRCAEAGWLIRGRISHKNSMRAASKQARSATEFRGLEGEARGRRVNDCPDSDDRPSCPSRCRPSARHEHESGQQCERELENAFIDYEVHGRTTDEMR